MAVLLVSVELDEIMALSDRIAVMYEGQIVGTVDADEITREELGLLMAGSELERDAAATGAERKEARPLAERQKAPGWVQRSAALAAVGPACHLDSAVHHHHG